jgi:hypothetical protein
MIQFNIGEKFLTRNQDETSANQSGEQDAALHFGSEE